MDQTCCTVEQLALIGVNAADMTQAFGWGFGAVVLFWSLGFGLGVAVDIIRKL
jgi:hypothetical protein